MFGGQGFQEKFPEGPPISSFVAFLITIVLKFAGGGGAIFSLLLTLHPSPLTPPVSILHVVEVHSYLQLKHQRVFLGNLFHNFEQCDNNTITDITSRKA